MSGYVMKPIDVHLTVDIEKFRYSLIGDGYLKLEALLLSEEELVEILKSRITTHIENEFRRGERLGLHDWEEE